MPIISTYDFGIKSKFHENKDWNLVTPAPTLASDWHQEQVPRKQGLKQVDLPGSVSSAKHQEQVPRKQGLKHRQDYPIDRSIIDIKSKFHENKDWNIDDGWLLGALEEASRASSTKTRIETCTGEHSGTFTGAHQEQVPRKQGLKQTTVAKHAARVGPSRASSTKTRIETGTRPATEYTTESSRASSTKTRIETMIEGGCTLGNYRHQEQVPRKQGLKPWSCTFGGSLATSIKSKFHENKDWNSISEACKSPKYFSSRASSTKTRIETCILDTIQCTQVYHQEQVPRKQGLKPKLQVYSTVHIFTSRASSTKTRIETSCLQAPRRRTGSRHQEQVPRKQGLKLLISQCYLCQFRHQEQVPRKQGLKHPQLFERLLAYDPSRASSTKTRIETLFRRHSGSKSQYASRASSTKTRIETSNLHASHPAAPTSRASSTKTRIETSWYC